MKEEVAENEEKKLGFINVSNLKSNQSQKTLSIDEVPQSTYLQVSKLHKKCRRSEKLHDEMIMITDDNYSVLYNIEKIDNLFEIEYIADQSDMTKNKYVSTGFQMLHREVEDDDDETVTEMRYFSNLLDRLYFCRNRNEEDGESSYEGFIYLRHSFLNILELKSINNCVENDMNIDAIDFECIVANYNGHTFFSIYENK